MTLYHGTNADFGEIDLTKSKPNKDFGQGFYLSREYAQAMDMAKTKVEQLETGTPIVLTYEVNDEQMATLKVLRFSDYSVTPLASITRVPDTSIVFSTAN